MKTFLNFIVLSNGSLIKKKSIKKKKINELLKDNYSLNYIYTLNNQIVNTTNNNVNTFIKKYK